MADRPFAYICSPYRGDTEANETRAREYCRQAVDAGYLALAPHLLFPQFLNDDVPAERTAGIEMANSLLSRCSLLVVCGERISEGMSAEIELANKLGIPVTTLDRLPAAERQTETERSEKLSNSQIFARIVSLSANSDTFATLDFPSTKEEVQAALKTAGVGRYDLAAARDYVTEDSYLHMRLPELSPIDELNYLAVKLSGMNSTQREVFEAVLETGKHCGSIREIINLTENLGRFDLHPALNAEEYGVSRFNNAMKEFEGVIGALYQTGDEKTDEFMDFFMELRDHIDYESYGLSIALQENGTFTEMGYLTGGTALPEIYHGQEDIPPVYRVFAVPDPEPYAKVENTDLAALVYKIHALAGDYMSDANYNVSALANGSSDYLMLMGDRSIFLCEIGLSYYQDHTANETWMRWDITPDTKAFSLHVTNREGDRVFGNLVEIDPNVQREDIRTNSFYFTHLDAKLTDGTERSYTLDEWDAMELIDRDKLQSWVIRFDASDIDNLTSHLIELNGQRTESAKPVSADELLSDINSVFMEKAKGAQTNMLRVAQDAAKEMLARGDCPVYRFFPNGIQPLTAMDAVRGGLDYTHYREFGVFRDHADGINKWAERGAGDIVRNAAHRAERDKPPKSRVEEL